MSMAGRPATIVSAGLSLVIPAYNEAACIRHAVEEADLALAGLASDYEILVVDDGSQDNTAEVVRAAVQARPRVRLLQHTENRGYGAALRTGFEAARFDRIAFTDADCQFDLSDLACLVPHTDACSLAVGYRIDRQDAWSRRLYSRGYNLLVRTLLGTTVRDCDCALKVFRKEALARLLPRTKGFFVNAEMLTRARQLGYGVAELGVRHRPRMRGRSTVSLADIPRTLATLLPFWWSAVLFPGPAVGQDSNPVGHRTGLESYPTRSLFRHPLAFGLVMLVAALMFLSRLHGPLLEPDEARYAEIPRQMLAEGHWSVPILHGQPYYHKPPLLYWLVMGTYSTFGVHDWSARVVPCAAAFLTVLVTYLWGRRAVGPRTAFAGAIVLCLSARFVYLGRMLTMDSLLCLWVVLAWAAAHAAVRQRTLAWSWWCLSATACGLGMLTKGPVALALITVPLLAFQLLDLRTARPRAVAWLVYGMIALVLAAPWFVMQAVHDPTFVSEFFWTHNVLRFVQPVDHQGPLWYYLPGLVLGTLPWSLLLPSLGRFVGRRPSPATMRRPAGLGFILLTFVWCLVFFSAAGCKRPGYILPALAPLTLALGCYLDAALPRRLFQPLGAPSVQRLNRLGYQAALLVLTIGLVGSFLAVALEMQRPLSGGLLAAACAGGLLFLLCRATGRRAGVSWGVCAGLTLVLLYTALHQVLPGYERKFSLREQVRPQRPVTLDPAVPVVCYPHRWDSVSFYLLRDDIRVYSADRRSELIAEMRKRPSTLVFVKTDDAHSQAMRDLLRDLPASLEFVPRGQHGIVTTGIVRPRTEAPSTLFAKRDSGSP
jgi:dolichol-phosphate mannosyltransferase